MVPEVDLYGSRLTQNGRGLSDVAGHVSGGSKENEGSQDEHMSDSSASSECVVSEQLAIKEYDGPHGGHRTARPRRVEQD